MSGAGFLKGMLAGTIKGAEDEYQRGLALQQKQDFEQWRLQQQQIYAKATRAAMNKEALAQIPLTAQANTAAEMESLKTKVNDPTYQASRAKETILEQANRDTAQMVSLGNKELAEAQRKQLDRLAREQILRDIGNQDVLLQKDALETEREMQKIKNKFTGLTGLTANLDLTNPKEVAAFDLATGGNLGSTLARAAEAKVASPAYIASVGTTNVNRQNLAIKRAVDTAFDSAAWDDATAEHKQALEQSIAGFTSAMVGSGPEALKDRQTNFSTIVTTLRQLNGMGENNPMPESRGLLDAIERVQEEGSEYVLGIVNGQTHVEYPSTKAGADQILAYARMDQEERDASYAWLNLKEIAGKRSSAVNSPNFRTPQAPPILSEINPPNSGTGNTGVQGPPRPSEAGFSGVNDFAMTPDVRQGRDANYPGVLQPAVKSTPDQPPVLAPVEDPLTPPPVGQPETTGQALLTDEMAPDLGPEARQMTTPYEYPNYDLPAHDDLPGNKARFIDDMVAMVKGPALGKNKTDKQVIAGFKALMNEKIRNGSFPKDQEKVLFDELWPLFLKRMREE
jgi:hypothetical protein